MSGDIGVGGFLNEGYYHRDAIHVAVAPVEAGEDLVPGDLISITEGKAYKSHKRPLGIVDPFLALRYTKVQKGQRFYIFLKPGSITSLRHEWTHPDFESAVQKVVPENDRAESVKWLMQYAAMVNPQYVDGTYGNSPKEAYDRLMEDIQNREMIYHGVDMHSFGDLIDAEQLRHHASIVLGYNVNWENFKYFSCSC